MLEISDAKRAHGRFFTQANPSDHPAFTRWAGYAGAPLSEPFA